MKYVLVLIMFFAGENTPHIYKYTAVDFIDEHTCVLFKDTKTELLEESVQRQFGHKGIEYMEMNCWSWEEWLQYYESIIKREGA